MQITCAKQMTTIAKTIFDMIVHLFVFFLFSCTWVSNAAAIHFVTNEIEVNAVDIYTTARQLEWNFFNAR